jgi:very-short-patch-repair endonuclease
LHDFAGRLSLAAGCDEEFGRALICGSDAEVARVFAEEFSRSLKDANRLADLPPLLFSGRQDSAWFGAAMRTAIEVSRIVPSVHVGITGTAKIMAEWKLTASRHAVAVASEGVLDLEPSGTECPPDITTSTVDLGMARSVAELRLHEQLQARSRTRDLFVLNAKLRESFGTAALEVDLLCEKLKLAIEVDGYHHFQDHEAYRRDRRKDLRLQQLGYMVIRVLASDVVEERDYVLSAIDLAIVGRERKHDD